MENLSLSRQPNKSSTKKACNGGGGRTNYDDVFGGPPKFGVPSLAPRVDDYAEIFGGFHAARGGGGSIPVLDLPVVEEEDVFFDVSSTGFDYEEVFGGCGRGFGVSFEELMMKMEADEEEANGGGDDGDSSDEAWYVCLFLLLLGCTKKQKRLQLVVVWRNKTMCAINVCVLLLVLFLLGSFIFIFNFIFIFIFF